jgi:hypothetical protein
MLLEKDKIPTNSPPLFINKQKDKKQSKQQQKQVFNALLFFFRNIF